MNEGNSSVIFIVLITWIALFLPAVMVWGWARWFKRSEPRTLSSNLSFGGFVFANISVLLALSATLFLHSSAGSPLGSSLLLRLYSIGLVLSVLGVILCVAGLRRSSPLRWPGLLCAGGVLMFWIFTGV
ncbi:MAG: hypothetical protein WA823_17960 [Candidatus Acidiferrales bacterium]